MNSGTIPELGGLRLRLNTGIEGKRGLTTNWHEIFLDTDLLGAAYAALRQGGNQLEEAR